MILCDAGPLISLIDIHEVENHRRCLSTLTEIRGPLLSTWPCFTEAMYLLGTRGGHPLQKLLWKYVDTGSLYLHMPSDEEIVLMPKLMAKYSDLPMDLPDATLVAAATVLEIPHVFTLDKHFYAYRINGTTPFDVVPT